MLTGYGKLPLACCSPSVEQLEGNCILTLCSGVRCTLVMSLLSIEPFSMFSTAEDTKCQPASRRKVNSHDTDPGDAWGGITRCISWVEDSHQPVRSRN